MDKNEYIQKLRASADFLEKHTELPVPLRERIDIWIWEAGQFRKIVNEAGNGNKQTLDFALVFKPHGTLIEINVPRDQMCKQVQTGVRTVPAEPAKEAVPEHEEPVYAWHCPANWLGSSDHDVLTAGHEGEEE